MIPGTSILVSSAKLLLVSFARRSWRSSSTYPDAGKLSTLFVRTFHLSRASSASPPTMFEGNIMIRRPTSASWRFLSSSSSPVDPPNQSTKESTTPVHPHIRPPRKLRQVAEAATRDAATEDVADTDGSHRRKRRRKFVVPENRLPIVSYSTAEEYRLEELKSALKTWKNGRGKTRYQLADAFLTEELSEAAVHYKLYEAPTTGSGSPDDEGDVFIFSEGSVVFWNVAKDDAASFLKVLEQYAVKPYSRSIVEYEAEYLDYSYTEDDSNDEYYGPTPPAAENVAKLTSDGYILLRKSMNTAHPQLLSLVKYAYSDAIALSVKLAIYEALLQQYVDSIENVAEDIKTYGRISLSKDQVLRKTGELFFLRHSINLGSNVLDPPDFYWDRSDLEAVYRSMCAYLNIGRRTRIFNEKLNHCYSLVELLRDHLNNQHHVRLELMIIALICVEVFFEFLHYFEKYMSSASSV